MSVVQTTTKFSVEERQRIALHIAYALARRHNAAAGEGRMRIVTVTEGYVVYWLGDRQGLRRDPLALLRLVRRLIGASG